jgi:hypothetical protein
LNTPKPLSRKKQQGRARNSSKKSKVVSSDNDHDTPSKLSKRQFAKLSPKQQMRYMLLMGDSSDEEEEQAPPPSSFKSSRTLLDTSDEEEEQEEQEQQEEQEEQEHEVLQPTSPTSSSTSPVLPAVINNVPPAPALELTAAEDALTAMYQQGNAAAATKDNATAVPDIASLRKAKPGVYTVPLKQIATPVLREVTDIVKDTPSAVTFMTLQDRNGKTLDVSAFEDKGHALFNDDMYILFGLKLQEQSQTIDRAGVLRLAQAWLHCGFLNPAMRPALRRSFKTYKLKKTAKFVNFVEFIA